MGGPANEPSEKQLRTADNTLLLRIAFPAPVIRPLLLDVLSSSLHVKALEFAAFMVREWENAI